MSAVLFAYDGQIRRFVTQFIRMFSNFQVEFGQDSTGTRTLQTVPVYYGDASRQAAVILRNNSENTLNAVPAMAAYISGLTYARDRVQNPTYEGSLRIRERLYDEQSQTYANTQDGIYTVDRLMPAPYNLGMKLDIWTSNTDQKHQLIEQILPIFNPSLEIQSTVNYVDWSSLSVVQLNDVIYSSRSVPAGGDESIDIATLTFELPIWLSLPAKVKKGGVVTQIIANIYNDTGSFSDNIINIANTSQIKYTPLNYKVLYTGNILTLYTGESNDNDGIIHGTTTNWSGLVDLYGTLVNGISQVRLSFDHTDGAHEIVGTVAINPTNPTQLIFSPDAATLPANTLPPVTAIIDPRNVEVDSALLTPALGTRYLILNAIGDVNSDSAVAWAGTAGTNLIAQANDIIEWNGNYWTVSFDSSSPDIQYVTNLKTTVQYGWDGANWVKSYEGLYNAGDWSLVL